MSKAVNKPWWKAAFIEVLFCCLPLAYFAYLNLVKRDFAAMATYFVLLMFLFIGYIFFKNHELQQLKSKQKENR